MRTITPAPLLRFACRLDGVGSFAAGVLALGGSSSGAEWLGMPPALVLALGAFMAGYGAFVGWLGGRERLARALVLTIAAGNAGWVLGSLVLLAGPWIEPDSTGVAIILAQAAAVALFSTLQFAGLARSSGAPR
jgi:hypothetical protein